VEKTGGSSGVTGTEEDGELALLIGSLGDSSGTVNSRSETCSAAEMSCVGTAVSIDTRRAGTAGKRKKKKKINLRYEGRRA
jgi:hypothetical protein